MDSALRPARRATTRVELGELDREPSCASGGAAGMAAASIAARKGARRSRGALYERRECGRGRRAQRQVGIHPVDVERGDRHGRGVDGGPGRRVVGGPAVDQVARPERGVAAHRAAVGFEQILPAVRAGRSCSAVTQSASTRCASAKRRSCSWP
jgi:hypothetical protein